MEIYGHQKEILNDLISLNKHNHINKPWSNYKKNKEFYTISNSEIIDKIIELSKGKGWLGCFFALLYLSGCRVNEILTYKYLGRYQKEVIELTGKEIVKPGITPRNIYYYNDETDTKYLVIKSRNQKQNSKKGEDKIEIDKRIALLEKDNYKEIRIPCDEMFEDFKLILLLDDFFDIHRFYKIGVREMIASMKKNEYLNPFKDDLLDIEIFPTISPMVAYRGSKRYFGLSTHNFREIRMKHLREVYNFDVAELKIAGGWASSDMPLRYANASQQSLVKKFQKYKYEKQEKER